MKPVDQTTSGAPGGNCFSACVASLLELPIAEVPYFMGPPEDEWFDAFRAWLLPRGLWAVCFLVHRDDDRPPGLHILSGPTVRGEHSVVARGAEIIHDPHPSRAGLDDVEDVILLVPLDPALTEAEALRHIIRERERSAMREVRSVFRRSIRKLVAKIGVANSALADARAALHRDRSGLAAALGKIVQEVEGRSWIADGRGPYEWDDDRYKDEAGTALSAVARIARTALTASGTLVAPAVRAIDETLPGAMYHEADGKRESMTRERLQKAIEACQREGPEGGRSAQDLAVEALRRLDETIDDAIDDFGECDSLKAIVEAFGAVCEADAVQATELRLAWEAFDAENGKEVLDAHNALDKVICSEPGASLAERVRYLATRSNR